MHHQNPQSIVERWVQQYLDWSKYLWLGGAAIAVWRYFVFGITIDTSFTLTTMLLLSLAGFYRRKIPYAICRWIAVLPLAGIGLVFQLIYANSGLSLVMFLASQVLAAVFLSRRSAWLVLVTVSILNYGILLVFLTETLRPMVDVGPYLRSPAAWVTMGMGEVLLAFICMRLIMYVKDEYLHLSERYEHRSNKASEPNLQDVERQRMTIDRARSMIDYAVGLGSDLRVPVHEVMGLIDLLRHTDLDREQRARLEQLRVSSLGLQGLLWDSMDLAHIESGRVDLKSVDFDIQRVFQDLQYSLGSTLRSRGFELVLQGIEDLSLRVSADPNRLAQLFRQLILIAAKGGERGRILAQVSVELTDEQLSLAFEVFCPVPGFTEQQLRTMRDQTDDVSADVAWRRVRLLASAFSASLRVDGGFGQTSKIDCQLSLPLSKESENWLDWVIALRDQRAIVVESDLIALEILQSYLGELGILVDGTVDGLEAVQKLHAEPKAYSAIFVSGMVEGFDSSEVVRVARQMNPNAIVILLVDKEPVHSSLQNADVLDGVLIKPLFRWDMLQMLAKAASQRKSNDVRYWKALGNRSLKPVLLIEDNEINQLVVTELLRQHGFRVQILSHGLAALEWLSVQGTSNFGMMLLDLCLPGAEGLEILERLRSLPGGDAIPVLVWTANASEESRAKLDAFGVHGWLDKPVVPEQLLKLLRDAYQIRE